MGPGELAHVTDPDKRHVDDHKDREEEPQVDILMDRAGLRAIVVAIAIIFWLADAAHDGANLAQDEVDVVGAEASLCAHDQDLGDPLEAGPASLHGELSERITMLICRLEKQTGDVQTQG